MKQKKSIENYLKVIYILSEQKEVHGVVIAGELRILTNGMIPSGGF